MKNPLNFLYQRTILLAVFSSFIAYSIFCQSREELEKQRYAIVEEIDATNKLLAETAENRKAVLSDLEIISTQIENRKKLLDQIQKEIGLIDNDIIRIGKRKEVYEGDIDSLRKQYQVLLRAAYRESSMKNPLVSVLSIRSMGDAFLKSNYYNRLKTLVANKVEGINAQQAKLDNEITTLNTEKSKKTQMLQNAEQQSDMLINEQDKQKTMIASLKEDEASLRNSLSTQKKEREAMNVAIENLIKSNFNEKPAISKSSNTASTAASSLKFEWPVQGGVVSSKYGKQRHPTISNLTISNNGIDIRALKFAEVKAITSGKVVSVTEMQGYGKTIIVDHSEFYAVYSKLGEVFVSQNETLSVNQVVGTLAAKNNQSELHFEIWVDNKTQNPIKWLKK